MYVRKFSLLIGLLMLFMPMLACTINIGGPAYPDQRIPISTQAVGELQTAMETAVAAGEASGRVTLVVSESQLTSYLAARLQTQAQPLFTDPQVYLRDGHVQIYGMAQQGYLQATIQIVVTAGIDDQGQLRIELTSADFGPLPVPSGLTEVVSAALQELYTGAIGPAAVGFRLESITTTDGTMTIVGRIK
jgi:uncharacterized protein YpmS